MRIQFSSNDDVTQVVKLVAALFSDVGPKDTLHVEICRNEQEEENAVSAVTVFIQSSDESSLGLRKVQIRLFTELYNRFSDIDRADIAERSKITAVALSKYRYGSQLIRSEEAHKIIEGLSIPLTDDFAIELLALAAEYEQQHPRVLKKKR